ncbi:MAG: Holliday junction branch migration protein RuvA [Anaerotardibacter sp.]
MISFLRGMVAYKGVDQAIIEVQGVGYHLLMSVKGVAALPEIGQTTQVLTRLHVREDALTLYGFSSSEEKQVFEKLITVSGVGPKVALAVLSTYEPTEAIGAIVSGDEHAIQAVPGVGKKMASRIILELKEKFEGFESASSQVRVVKENASAKQVTEALLSMGFSSAEAELALRGAAEDLGESALLRYALRRLGA